MKINKLFVLSAVVMLVGVTVFAPKIKAGIENPPAIVPIPGTVEQTQAPLDIKFEEEDYSKYINGNVLTIKRNLSQPEKDQFLADFQKRGHAYASQVKGEIFRFWKNNIEVNKFKNAILLERAGAPVTVVNTSHHHNVEAVRLQPQVQE